jgi:hypothetical protein
MMKMHGLGDAAYWAIQVKVVRCMRRKMHGGRTPHNSGADARPGPYQQPLLATSTLPTLTAVWLVLRHQLCLHLDFDWFWQVGPPYRLPVHPCCHQPPSMYLYMSCECEMHACCRSPLCSLINLSFFRLTSYSFQFVFYTLWINCLLAFTFLLSTLFRSSKTGEAQLSATRFA